MLVHARGKGSGRGVRRHIGPLELGNGGHVRDDTKNNPVIGKALEAGAGGQALSTVPNPLLANQKPYLVNKFRNKSELLTLNPFVQKSLKCRLRGYLKESPISFVDQELKFAYFLFRCPALHLHVELLNP